MAMICCPECKKKISETANSCPKCGCQLTPEKVAEIKKNELKAQKGCAFGCLTIIAIILLISLFLSLVDDSTDTKETNNAKQVDSKMEEEAQEAEKFLDTRKNIKLIVEALDKNYGIKAVNEFVQDYCLHDKFCEVYADSVQIQAIGYTVTLLASSQVTPAYYQQVCSAVLIALSDGANKELVEQTITQYFNDAAQNGSARANVLGVDIKITPDSRGILECTFVKKW